MVKCIRCWIEKDKSFFYSHPETLDWILHKCKECCKESARWKYNPSYETKRNKEEKRKADKKRHLSNFRNNNPEKWKAQSLVNNFFRAHPEMKPKQSIVSGVHGLILMHHPDYSKPNEIIPCTPLEHSMFHRWTLNVQDYFIIKLPINV